ncbi:TPA: hypothetical protein ACMY2T_002100 [Legionella pneumophila]
MPLKEEHFLMLIISLIPGLLEDSDICQQISPSVSYLMNSWMKPNVAGNTVPILGIKEFVTVT